MGKLAPVQVSQNPACIGSRIALYRDKFLTIFKINSCNDSSQVCTVQVFQKGLASTQDVLWTSQFSLAPIHALHASIHDFLANHAPI
jgi:hypothetical protein